MASNIAWQALNLLNSMFGTDIACFAGERANICLRLQNEQTMRTQMVRTLTLAMCLKDCVDMWESRTGRKPSGDIDIMGAVHIDHTADPGAVRELYTTDEEDTGSA